MYFLKSNTTNKRFLFECLIYENEEKQIVNTQATLAVSNNIKICSLPNESFTLHRFLDGSIVSDISSIDSRKLITDKGDTYVYNKISVQEITFPNGQTFKGNLSLKQ